jgi:hypothetical protein
MLILFFYKINTYIILGINQISCPYVNVFFVQEDVWAWVKSYDPSLLKNQHVNKKLKKKQYVRRCSVSMAIWLTDCIL